MKISDWLFAAMIKLGEAEVDSPRRDALVLLEDTLEKDRSWVLAHSDHELRPKEIEAVDQLIERRVKREPLAYIRNKAWFYGRFFYVDENVLIPRPESESIITLAKVLEPQSAIDVGTGSGCLAITLSLELPDAEITAVDTSSEAIEICRRNAITHEVKIQIIKGYLLDNLLAESAPDLVIANLPYVPDGLITSPEISTEPELALFGGSSGMDIYESFWGQLSTAVHRPPNVITECLESQHSQMNALAVRSGYRLAETKELVQRWIRGQRTS